MLRPARAPGRAPPVAGPLAPPAWEAVGPESGPRRGRRRLRAVPEQVAAPAGRLLVARCWQRLPALPQRPIWPPAAPQVVVAQAHPPGPVSGPQDAHCEEESGPPMLRRPGWPPLQMRTQAAGLEPAPHPPASPPPVGWQERTPERPSSRTPPPRCLHARGPATTTGQRRSPIPTPAGLAPASRAAQAPAAIRPAPRRQARHRRASVHHRLWAACRRLSGRHQRPAGRGPAGPC